MDWDILARALHVVGVVMWIGGVGFVTLVLLPAVREVKTPAERVRFFEAAERRFAAQARLTTLLVGATGFYMVDAWDLWSRFTEAAYWWMHGMAAVWVLFTLMLFVLEPLFLHRWFVTQAEKHPDRTFAVILWLHRGLLAVSLIVVLGAVAGAHGG